MTLRSRRRAAELAVIEAARNSIGLYGYVQPSQEQLRKAIEHLDALQLEEPNGVPIGHNQPPTSHEAAAWMRASATKVSGQVFAAILRAYRGGGVGLTTEQIEQTLGRSHQSVSPRVYDLRNKGYITDSGVIRRTKSHQKAIVWSPTQVALDASKEGGMPWSWPTSTDSATVGF